MTFAEIKDLLEAGSYVATIIGIPVALLIFLHEKKKQRAAQELETYLHSIGKYVEYLNLCLEHPDLDCFDLSILEPQVAAAGLDIRKLTLLSILIATLESGFLLYRRHGKTSVAAKQWHGWKDYLTMWASRPDFRKAWPVIGSQFDEDFGVFMDQLIKETKPMLEAPPTSQPASLS